MGLVGNRRGELVRQDNRLGQVHLEFTIPARGLIGLRTRLLNSTSGEAIMHHTFFDYQASRGTIPGRLNGVLISTETGRATPYALDGLQDRGILFVTGGDQVYEGQIVGEHHIAEIVRLVITSNKFQNHHNRLHPHPADEEKMR